MRIEKTHDYDLVGALIGDPEPVDLPAPDPFRILPAEAS
jgi:hypothetical protein